MERIILNLKDITKEVIDRKDIDIQRRCIIEKALLEAVGQLEYVKVMCERLNIKLGD